MIKQMEQHDAAASRNDVERDACADEVSILFYQVILCMFFFERDS